VRARRREWCVDWLPRSLEMAMKVGLYEPEQPIPSASHLGPLPGAS